MLVYELGQLLPIGAIIGCFGAGLGLLLPLTRLSQLFFGWIAATSLAYKGLTACATCELSGLTSPTATFSIAGCAFLLAALQWIGSDSTKYRTVAILCCSAILAAHVVLWWSTKQNCTPCSVAVGCYSSILGSNLATDSTASVRVRKTNLLRVFIPTISLAVLVSAWFFNSPTKAALKPSRIPWKKSPRIVNVSEIGEVSSTNSRRVILVASSGCRACTELDSMISMLDLKVDYRYIGATRPTSPHDWTPLRGGDSITETPTLLLVEKGGSVTDQHVGFDSSFEGVKLLTSKLMEFGVKKREKE
jgi:hypothetical protein